MLKKYSSLNDALYYATERLVYYTNQQKETTRTINELEKVLHFLQSIQKDCEAKND